MVIQKFSNDWYLKVTTTVPYSNNEKNIVL